MKICKHCNKRFKPKRVKQEDCSELCLSQRFDTLTRKTRKIAKIFAGTMGYRSMSEVRFASRLKSSKVPFTYEDTTFTYQYKPQKYTPDFTLTRKTKKKVYLEYKGKLDGKTRKKMRAIRDSNPTLDVRLVFEKPKNKIYAGAKTRYWEWAERNGFKWYDAKDIKKIKRDLKR